MTYMYKKSIKLDRVKTVVKENIWRAVNTADQTGRLTLLAMKSFLDGDPPCVTRETRTLTERIIEYVDAADAHRIHKILTLVPQGTDSRIPAWLYGTVEAWLEDDGSWTLYPTTTMTA